MIYRKASIHKLLKDQFNRNTTCSRSYVKINFIASFDEQRENTDNGAGQYATKRFSTKAIDHRHG